MGGYAAGFSFGRLVLFRVDVHGIGLPVGTVDISQLDLGSRPAGATGLEGCRGRLGPPAFRSAIRPLGFGAPDGTACSDCDLRNRFCRHHSPCRTPARVQRGATHLAPPWCLAMDRLGSPGDSRLVLLDPPMAPAWLRRARIPSVFDRVLFDPRSAPLWPGISGDIRHPACPVLLPSRLVYPDAPEIGHWGSRMT